MLLSKCAAASVDIRLSCNITAVKKLTDGAFKISTNQGVYTTNSLVIASGGLSIPKMGATAFGYEIAKQFNHHVWPTTAGLVPFTMQPNDKGVAS